jgi:lipase ATG15
MESRCHLGKTIVYDAVSNLSWGVDIRKHAIVNMIETVLADPWPPAEELGREVPEAVPQDDCVVSFSPLPFPPRRSFEIAFGDSILLDH